MCPEFIISLFLLYTVNSFLIRLENTRSLRKAPSEDERYIPMQDQILLYTRIYMVMKPSDKNLNEDL